jgi:starch phosphorylase
VAQEVTELRTTEYDPRQYYHVSDELRGVIDVIAQGRFSNGDPQLFRPVVDELRILSGYLACDAKPC